MVKVAREEYKTKTGKQNKNNEIIKLFSKTANFFMYFGFFVLRTDLFDFFYHGNGHCLFTGLACSKILTCLLFHLKIEKMYT